MIQEIEEKRYSQMYRKPGSCAQANILSLKQEAIERKELSLIDASSASLRIMRQSSLTLIDAHLSVWGFSVGEPIMKINLIVTMGSQRLGLF